MARRGDQLREHILLAGKDVFLEMGFERASMDAVAARAETSKRSLYAHFESKEKLFLEVVEHVRGLFIGRLKMPADYSEKPAEALVGFCARYQQILLYGPSIRMCRLCVAEAARFPEFAAQYFDVIFSTVLDRIAAYLKGALAVAPKAASAAAQRLLGQVVHPRYLRALFGMDALAERIGDEAANVELEPIRRAVADVLASLGPPAVSGSRGTGAAAPISVRREKRSALMLTTPS